MAVPIRDEADVPMLCSRLDVKWQLPSQLQRRCQVVIVCYEGYICKPSHTYFSLTSH